MPNNPHASELTRRLADAQDRKNYESPALVLQPEAIVYTIETEHYSNLARIINRYFDGFNIQVGTGYYRGQSECSATIRIVATRAQLQAVMNLCGDIRYINKQESIILTYAPVTRLDVTCEAYNDAFAAL